MKTISFKHISKALDDYDLLLFDLWGVIIEDDKFYPGIIDAVNNILRQKKCFFVSNAPRPDFVMTDKLKSWGLENVTKDMIITSGDIAREIILAEKGKLYSDKPVIYHLGADQNDDILRNFDHIITDDYKKADVFLISMFRDQGQNIREFDELLKNVAKEKSLLKICSNPDVSIPKGDIVRYCAGYFARIVEENGGDMIYTGKPKKVMYDYVLSRAGNIPKNRILMIGDTFETDILGGQEAGIHSALVMTGNAHKFHSMCKSLEDKISALTTEAYAVGAIPTFITELV
jgi:HAD superfamily hydrolase (TIGR01459 family)